MQWCTNSFHLFLAFLSLFCEPSNCMEDLSKHPNLKLIPRHICGPSVPESRITNGKRVNFFELPWMANLIMKRRGNTHGSICGGSLINDRYILTAAHCVGKTFPHLVRLGEITVEKDTFCNVCSSSVRKQCCPKPQEFEVEKIIPHPNFALGRTKTHDIALVRLSGKADFKSRAVLPICLPLGIYGDNVNLAGRLATVAGWGRTERGKFSAHLLRTSVPVRNISDCVGKLSPEAQICAGGYEDGSDTCQGDSGGPMTLDEFVEGQWRTVQIGISSFGDVICGTPGYPAIYISVSHYMKWILDNIEP